VVPALGPDVLTLPIYLDNHSTTRTDPRVVEAMLPFFTEIYGNAASISHRFGWEAGEAVDRARQQVAAAIGAEPKEIVFTSGATESNNLAIKGVAQALKRKGSHLVTAVSEHKAVLDTMRRLAREGWDLTVASCDETGRAAIESIEAALTDRTVLVSIMAANNEVGTLNPIREIGRLCRDRGVVFHTDAQPFGTQVLRSQGRGCPVRAAAESPGAARSPGRWGRARAGAPERNAGGADGRRAGSRGRAGCPGTARGIPADLVLA
jgi:cysteine sulfinate desulfinase/cysteine desulfurase-like protein